MRDATGTKRNRALRVALCGLGCLTIACSAAPGADGRKGAPVTESSCDGERVPWSDESAVVGSLGFSAADLSWAFRDEQSDAVWLESEWLQPSNTLTPEVNVRLLRAEGPAEVSNENSSCAPGLYLPATVELSSSDGQLAETLSGHILSQREGLASFWTQLPLDALEGNLHLQADASDDRPQTMTVELHLSPSRLTGAINLVEQRSPNTIPASTPVLEFPLGNPCERGAVASDAAVADITGDDLEGAWLGQTDVGAFEARMSASDVICQTPWDEDRLPLRVVLSTPQGSEIEFGGFLHDGASGLSGALGVGDAPAAFEAAWGNFGFELSAYGYVWLGVSLTAAATSEAEAPSPAAMTLSLNGYEGCEPAPSLQAPFPGCPESSRVPLLSLPLQRAEP